MPPRAYAIRAGPGYANALASSTRQPIKVDDLVEVSASNLHGRRRRGSSKQARFDRLRREFDTERAHEAFRRQAKDVSSGARALDQAGVGVG